MKTQEIFIAHPHTNKQVSALKAFMQALKIDFQISNNDSYDSDFVDKINESRKQMKEK